MLAGIDAARSAGFTDLKLDTVITRGDNDDELVELLEFAREVGAEVRFIEYMDVGGATQLAARGRRLARARCSSASTEHYGADHAARRAESSAPAARVPAARTARRSASSRRRREPFCRTCDRARLTADGVLLLCLYAQHGTDLRRPLRAGASRETLLQSDLARCGQAAPIAAPKNASAVRERGAYIPLSVLKKDAHLEMHTRGG